MRVRNRPAVLLIRLPGLGDIHHFNQPPHYEKSHSTSLLTSCLDQLVLDYKD